MKNAERKIAKRIDSPQRARSFTDRVYSGTSKPAADLWDDIRNDQRTFLPSPPEYRVYFGDLHGHSCMSDGNPTPDEYFTKLRDAAKLDFAALTDHDHGGVGKPELWLDGKWEYIKQKVKEYNSPGNFTTILGYEKDAYPWYNNLVVYYNNHDGELLIGEQNGEMSRKELREYLKRDDIILVPHDTWELTSGADFLSMDVEDITSLIQVSSRFSYSERYQRELLMSNSCEGGYWQDALKRGAKMGCISCSDDHDGNGGLNIADNKYPETYPGITGVWAKENTLESIFEALKARRCYGFMGGRIMVDFRINGHYMGEEFTTSDDREIYFNVEADAPIESITVVKNCRDYVIFAHNCNQKFFYDYRAEDDTDYYYIRVRLVDGRYAWTSPIWINKDREF